MNEADIEKLINSLSPIERQVLQFINLNSIKEISAKTKLNSTAVIRAFHFLESKGIISLKTEKRRIIDLDVNGILYMTKGLPERRLLNALIDSKESLDFASAKKQASLSDNEFTIALGVLKEKSIINVLMNKINLKGSEEATKKTAEEKFLESLPLEFNELNAEQKISFEKLRTRKSIVRLDEKTEFKWEVNEVGKKVIESISDFKTSLIEQLTSDMLKKKSWKGKQFRRYDLSAKVPNVIGGRRHFYYAFLEEIREKLINLGFEEMSGPIVVNEFWNFDALFQPQFHVAREWTDNYHISNKLKSISVNKKIIDDVKKEHEDKWRYEWNEKQAERFLLRPQGTVLSALTLASQPKVPGKYFALARVFRPDVVDSTHLTEFNQLEGIVIGKKLNFKHLLAILKMFAEEIVNADEIKFLPDYYPFTEPSVELDVKKNGKYIEIGGAGIFRDEVVHSLMPDAKKNQIKVLAWGLGVDRLAMLRFNLQDIRELFTKRLEFLRTVPIR